MKARKIFLSLSLAFTLAGFSQNEFSKWYFGTQAGLDFSTAPPTILTNMLINTLSGVAAVCDGSGNLLFYTDGSDVITSTHTIMANGSGLNGGQGTSTQAAIIVQQPASTTIYYIFTTGTGPAGFGYSIVDMSLAAGFGSVTVKNATLYATTCEKQVAVRHCNGKDVWIVSHHYGTNEFRAYLLTSTGVSSTPVVSAIGETIAGNVGARIGHLKISPDGKKLAMATSTTSAPTSLGTGGFHLFDFDAGTGIVSNSLTILSHTNLIPGLGAYGVEFSPDGSKLYGTTDQIANTNTVTLHQWNICAGSSAALIASHYSIAILPGAFNQKQGSVQRAIDGKLYISTSGTQSLHVVNNPNSSGAAMGFVQNGQSVAPGTLRLGLPNYINNFTPSLPSMFNHSIACQTTSFFSPSPPSFTTSVSCSLPQYQYNSYLWDFGDGNTSQVANPVHTYSVLGTYTVNVIAYSNCRNDTMQKVIILTTLGPTVDVQGITPICKGDKRTYTVTGGSSYNWSNGSTSPTVALNPTQTTVYTASASLNGCTLSKSFTLTVNPCNGIENLNTDNRLLIYPNPVNEVLDIETSDLKIISGKLQVINAIGQVVKECEISDGKTKINVNDLSEGIYILSLRSRDENFTKRFVIDY
jgi:PKD repeat protein